MQKYIFNRKYLSRQFESFKIDEIENIKKRHKIIKNWNYSLEQSNLEKTKEESIQGDFLNQLFTEVLGYKNRIGEKLWNIQQEEKTKFDNTKADGSLGFFSESINDVRVVVELKNAKTDLDRKQNRAKNQSPVEQAFSYQFKNKNTNWVIVSNFKEIRLYNAKTIMEYEQFFIKDMAEDIEVFKRFIFLLQKDHLINRDGKSRINILYENNEKEEEKITKEFYLKYKQIRKETYQHIVDNNKNVDELESLEKTQKLLDRFIFVCFCEDTELLPENIFRQVVNVAKRSFDLSDTKIWNQLKGLFHSIDKGNPPMDINRFNGGLFQEDPVLDNLIIKDEIFTQFEDITKYDFGSELSVNILGHVFEQSISDIEEFKAEINEDEFDKSKGKRKKDGIFYTPEYITDFIVDYTISGWLDEQRENLGEDKLPSIPEPKKVMKKEDKSARTRAINRNLKFWEDYRDILRGIRIIDPACGSGAFLVQAFDYLYEEGQKVNKIIAELQEGQTTLFDLDEHILKHNLFGMDINKESVEITKLSLWIKTANKNAPLTSLDENIRYGDTLLSNSFEKESFDIVLGNPPYVRQESLGDLKYDLEKRFEVYTSSLDLFGYFYEQSYNLLKTNGWLGFISNSFTKTTAALNLRTFLKNRTTFIHYVDFSDVQIFEGAVTYPAVIILKKAQDYKNLFSYYKVTAKALTTLPQFYNAGRQLITQQGLDENSWDFVSEDEKQLKNKLFSLPTIKDKLGKTYYGVKTGLNKAFIINDNLYNKISEDNPDANQILVPYLEGKDLYKWNTVGANKWLIFIHKGWTYETVGEHTTEVSGESFLEKNYPALYNHLKTFKTAAKKRHDKGDFWWELRTCDYIKEFQMRKIIWPNLQKSPTFSYDRSSFFLNAPAVMMPTELSWVTGILNSQLSWYLLKTLCVVRNGGYIEVKPQYLERFPLPQIEDTKILKDLNNITEKILEYTNEKQKVQHKFLRYLKESYGLIKTSRKINNFHLLNFKDFNKELIKQKIKLNEKQKYGLLDIFEGETLRINQLSENIREKELHLDVLVYDLYGLADFERQIVENG